jgi:hypothetical protein
MALSYPLTFPTVQMPVSTKFRASSAVGVSVSPFTKEQQIYAHQGDALAVDIQMPPMERDDAETVVGFLLALNGMEGTYLLGDPANTGPRGTWAGSPKVFGAHAAGVKSVAMDGFSAGATVKAGDWFQTGSGSSTHLHKLVQDATADGSGLLTLEIRPPLRAALADNATFVTSGPKGLWRLASNDIEWSIEGAQLYGVQFSAIEAL